MKDAAEVTKFNFLQKVGGFFTIAIMFIVFIIDRTLHILLPHREHQQFTVWAKDSTNIKYSFSRLFIFSLPIIIFKIFF